MSLFRKLSSTGFPPFYLSSFIRRLSALFVEVGDWSTELQREQTTSGYSYPKPYWTLKWARSCASPLLAEFNVPHRHGHCQCFQRRQLMVWQSFIYHSLLTVKHSLSINSVAVLGLHSWLMWHLVAWLSYLTKATKFPLPSFLITAPVTRYTWLWRIWSQEDAEHEDPAFWLFHALWRDIVRFYKFGGKGHAL